ncbi:S8 family serine peptidase [Aureimonas psammosilenae]|uniref:S8 family serine peptidase n=1 Tax=Aureimonas psammosilenae TaxID=2495496 RepID=UPI0012608243|nr:S8 family serine peptidase [Aureimonas psammosilenae]
MTIDPLLSKQWHLSVIGVDRLGGEFDGSGVTTGVFDDGVQRTHEDLSAAYDASLEFKIGGVAQAPDMGSATHGTAVAGIIAATAGNGIGGIGISPGVRLAGIDVFGNAGGSNLLPAMRHMADFDTVNTSWGWSDPFADSLTTAFGKAFTDTLKVAADTGRNGLGTVVVQSAGNEWNDDHRSANNSEFGASRYSITVGAIGQDGDVASYSNRGSSLLVSAPSNGGGNGIVTTDETGSAGYKAGNYTDTFGGTSAAAPIVTGVVNLMLDASNNVLGWRDVQSILAITADQTTPTTIGGKATGSMEYGWQINGAVNVNGGGMHYSNDVGFGQVDAFEAVRFAEVWHYFGVPKISSNELSATVSATVSKALADGGTTVLGIKVADALTVEHADLTLTFDHPNVKELRVELVSPDGTSSILMDAMSGTAAGGGAWTWTFGAEAVRGVSSVGDWSVRITDTKTGNVGTLQSYKLDLYGAAPSNYNVYHYTNEAAKMIALDPSRAVLSDDNGGADWINLASQTGSIKADLSAANGGIWFDGVRKVQILAGIESAVTGDGADTLVGNGSSNVLVGMRGNDFLSGKGGDDLLDGGAGTDTAGFIGRIADYVVQQGTDALGAWVKIADTVTGRDGTDMLYNIERFSFADALVDLAGLLAPKAAPVVAPVPAPVVVAAPAPVVTPAPVTVPVSLPTSSGGTTFTMTTKADNFVGTAGNDVFKFVSSALNGADKIDGGAGIDTLDFSDLAAGYPVTFSASGAVFSVGNSVGNVKGVENIVGTKGNDVLYGNELANRIEGGAGNDTLKGYAGADTFVFRGASGSDRILDFRQGEDLLDFGKGMDLAHLSVRTSGADLIVADADSFVTIVGGKSLVLMDHDFFL